MKPLFGCKGRFCWVCCCCGLWFNPLVKVAIIFCCTGDGNVVMVVDDCPVGVIVELRLGDPDISVPDDCESMALNPGFGPVSFDIRRRLACGTWVGPGFGATSSACNTVSGFSADVFVDACMLPCERRDGGLFFRGSVVGVCAPLWSCGFCPP